jgi:hypothetical protein
LIHNSFFREKRNWLTVIFIALLMFFIPFMASANDLLNSKAASTDFKEWELVYTQLGVAYHYFTDDGMNEAYTGCISMPFRLTARGEKTPNSTDRGIKIFKSGFQAETGLIFAVGKPLQKDPDWEIVESHLGLIAIPLFVSYIYRVVDDGSDSFAPYCGLGLGGFFGFERISANIYRQQLINEPHYEWHDTCYRHSFAGHACLGIYKKINEQYGLLFEIRWTQAGKGKLKRGTLSEEELDEGWGEVFDDFQHADFNFTGPSASLSLRW